MNDLFASTVTKLPMSDKERLSWLRLIRTDSIGPITFYKLVARYGSAAKALEMLPELSKRSGKVKPVTPFSLSDAEKELARIEKFGAKLICAGDEIYPLALSAIEDAPPVITVKGRAELLNKQGIGMVGSRNASLNGRRFAEKLARDLGQGGQIITSGLARGIDTSAHHGALETGTIAVIAGGIDIIYPEENKALYEKICDQGCMVAESPFSQVPFAQSFPKRNRIISGLSAGIIVVEASLRSGSLITARLAAEQGRDVFAVPGFPSDPRAQGPNKLIIDGAMLIQSADDVLNALNTFSRSIPSSFQELPQQSYHDNFEEDENVIEDARQIILSKLAHTPVQQDLLMRDCALNSSAFSSALLELEISGQVQRQAGGKISLAR